LRQILFFSVLLFIFSAAWAEEPQKIYDLCQDSKAKIIGEITIDLSKETRFQADKWLQIPFAISWVVYVEPYLGTIVLIYLIVGYITSKYKMANLQMMLGETSKINLKDCYTQTLKKLKK